MQTWKTPKGTELPMLDLRGKSYLQVAWRLVWFREEHPKWTIETAPVETTATSAFFCAKILDEERRVVATGHKFEDKQGFADFREKAETGAIGRALAMCGYGTQFCADELDEGSRVTDSPVERKPAPVQRQAPAPVSSIDVVVAPFAPTPAPVQVARSAGAGTWGPTEKQLKRLYAISKSKGWAGAEVTDYMMRAFQVATSSALTRQQYDELCAVIEANAYADAVDRLGQIANEDVPF